jgi:hypothetical protein
VVGASAMYMKYEDVPPLDKSQVQNVYYTVNNNECNQIIQATGPSLNKEMD